MKPLSALILATVMLAVAGPSSAAVPKLMGTVGPGFTITLKKGGVRVKTLKPGRYTFVIRDRADFHNFHLVGPRTNRTLTSVGFAGTKTVTIRLRAGNYRYFCDPHASDMRGSFRVR
jgi:plastocyanin